MAPDSALVLDNFLPFTDRVELRRGMSAFASALPGSVESLIPYSISTGSRLFAAAGTGMYSVGAGGAAGAADFTHTNARWEGTQFASSAVDALIIVNGTDQMRQYYSGSWTAVADLSGSFPTINLNSIAAYRQRLFFGIKGTLNFCYLPAGSITGTAVEFKMNQLAVRGGTLTAIGTWSADSGTGPDDYIVFITSEGEAIVFRGTDPSDATKWFHVGSYYIGPPLGARCLAKVGGDLWVLTKTGIVSCTRVMKAGRVSARDLISYPIQPTYERAVRESTDPFGWSITPYFDQGVVLVAYSSPATNGAQFVYQTGSGGWSRFTGWPGKTFAVWGGNLYHGQNTAVTQCLVGTDDLGAWIEGRLLTAYNYMGARSRKRHMKLVRPVFSTDAPFQYQMGLPNDFALPGYTSNVGGESVLSGVWDTDLWDSAFWGGGAEIQQLWRHVSNKVGYCHALALRVRTKTSTPALLSIDYLYEQAGLF
jgi:hypothetical protein